MIRSHVLRGNSQSWYKYPSVSAPKYLSFSFTITTTSANPSLSYSYTHIILFHIINMKSSIVAANALLMASAVTAAPLVAKRDAASDAVILNYALTLEHLEAEFYRQGLANYTEADFQKAGFNNSMFYQDLKTTAADEVSHVAFLTAALKAAGAPATAQCTYAFPSTDAASFMAVAQILEGVGVSAYLGAAASITNKGYLTAAGSILTTEARHSAFIRGSRGEVPFASPYDIPLDFDQVYSLAAPFIASCPSTNPTLPVKAFPMMTAPTGMATQGDKVTFDLGKDVKIPTGGLYIAWPLVTGPVFQSAIIDMEAMTATCTVPEGAYGSSGQSYAILTTNATMLTDDNTLAGPAVLEVADPLFPPYKN